MKRSWTTWIGEYRELNAKLDSGDELSIAEQSHRQYLKNLLEAGLGTKATLGEDCRRNQLRVPCSLNIEITEPFEVSAAVTNISEGGMLLEFDHDTPEMASEINIRVVAEVISEPIECGAIVQWIKSEPKPTIGVQFVNLSEKGKNDLTTLFYHLLEEAIKTNVDRKS